MKFLTYLLRNGAGKIILIASLGLVGGLVSASFVALINATLHSSFNRKFLFGAFVFIVIARAAANITAQKLLVGFSQNATLKLSADMCCRVLATPFRKLERIGPSNIMTTLTDDVSTLASAIQYVPSLVGHLAALVGCSIYLAWISWTGFLYMLVFTIVGALTYNMLQKKAFPAIEKARAGRDTLFRHFRSLTEGIKELKMNRARRSAFLESEIGSTMEYLRRQNLTAANQYLKADAWAQIMFYVMMGVLLFLLPVVQNFTVADLTRYSFIALFLMTPVWGVIGILPTLSHGQAALNRIRAIEITLGESEPSDDDAQPSKAAPIIELDQVSFTYDDADGTGTGFCLGPIDLTMRPGDLTFIVGGNGSGKSTLVKLLTGLYTPHSGIIRVNGHTITSDDDGYRQLFSTVFSDFFLFDRLPGGASSDLDQRAKKYLDRLNLAKIVDIEDGVLSTTALSQGQRRRLALLTAYMEDRPIYVFDEWAADQDPAYKQVFYAHLLPELKAAGKTVIVITHDDRYFHTGDYVITLESGRIVERRKREPVEDIDRSAIV